MTLAITAGPGPDCTCPYIGQTWHDGPMCWEFHQEPDPDCPAHQGVLDWAPDGTKFVYLDAPPWAALSPCRCSYYPFGSGPWWLLGSTFHINPQCLHHGSAMQVVA
jgi:hypothetical protein